MIALSIVCIVAMAILVLISIGICVQDRDAHLLLVILPCVLAIVTTALWMVQS